MSSKVVICGVNTATLPKLSEEETNSLLQSLKEGNKSARERFIVANFRLVLSVIKRFRLKTNNLDDVFQAGSIGLIKALDNFDLSFGVKFSTYAVPMIIGEIKRFLRNTNSLRVSRSIRDTAYQVLKTRNELEKEKKETTINSIAEKMQVAVSEVVYALDAIADPVSLYDPVYSKDGDNLLLMDQIGDEKNTDENWTEKLALNTAIEKLGERERKILFLRYYVGKTQTEISKEVNLSQAQVSRLEKTALKEIKNLIKA
ncbi:MAG: sigma-70 family RNA polymerase sigma factor [Clostridiales bacterium]|nr:sigma-70 family RNA polymerase sigma factor [Clostridiales bacterium]